MMVSRAVILAAGLGSRLGNLTQSSPKGFLEIDGIAIIRRSIEQLLSVGINQIIIGTGYLAEVYDALAREYPQVTCVRNDLFVSTGSMATLRGLCDHIDGDFLLLESDLVYERRLLLCVLDAVSDTAVLGSPPLNQGDDVFLSVNHQGVLTGVSKSNSALTGVDSVLVGISKVSLQTYRHLCLVYDKTDNKTLHYEDIFMRVSPVWPIPILPSEGLFWSEIDTPDHLAFVLGKIWPEILRRDGDLGIPRRILLNPGPLTTSNRVKRGLLVPDVCPREPVFGRVMRFVSQALVAFVGQCEDFVSVLFSGPGTAAVESMISSVVGDGKLLVIRNGAYGERMFEIASIYSLEVYAFDSSPTNAVDCEALELVLRKGGFTHLAMVHHETSTGLLVDVAEVAAIAKRYGCVVMVDAMSSYGAVPIDMAKMQIDFLAASANKNLQGMPGISFVIAGREALAACGDYTPRNFALNLQGEFSAFSRTGQSRFTPAVQVLYALREAIWELQREGIPERYRRYQENWKVLMSGLQRLGFDTVVDEADHSKLITTVLMPDGFDFDACHDLMFRQGFTIYPGKISRFNSFRIATIGQVYPQDLSAFIQALAEYCAVSK